MSSAKVNKAKYEVSPSSTAIPEILPAGGKPQETIHIAPFLAPESNSVQANTKTANNESPDPKKWHRHIPFTKMWQASISGPTKSTPSSPQQTPPPTALDPEGPDRSWEITAPPIPPRAKRSSKMWSSLTTSLKSPPRDADKTVESKLKKPKTSDSSTPNTVPNFSRPEIGSDVNQTPVLSAPQK